jgi:guanylate kinase
MQRKILLVIGGPSGAGKTKVIEWLSKFFGSMFGDVVTATTRRARIGERNGFHYQFLVPSQFMAQVNGGLFIEHALVHRNQYGIPLKSVERVWNTGGKVKKTPLLNIDSAGRESVVKYFASNQGVRVVSIFIRPPSLRILGERLQLRCQADGTSKETMLLRLGNAEAEMKRCNEYDHQVINHDLGTTVLDILEIVQNI